MLKNPGGLGNFGSDDEDDSRHRDLPLRNYRDSREGDYLWSQYVSGRSRLQGDSRNRNKKEGKRWHPKIANPLTSMPDKAALQLIFASDSSVKSNLLTAPLSAKHAGYNVVMVEDILEASGRMRRPEKVAIVMRGLPGSGKSFLSKMIYDRELQYGDSTPKLLSIDDYFLTEVEKEVKDENTAKKVKTRESVYKYDAMNEQTYMGSLIRSFNRNMTDGYYDFLILDCNNDIIKSVANSLNRAKQYGFHVYICELGGGVDDCHKRNIHNRKLEEIQVIHSRWQPTPKTFTILDCSSLLHGTHLPNQEVIEESEFLCAKDLYRPQPEELNKTTEWMEPEGLFEGSSHLAGSFGPHPASHFGPHPTGPFGSYPPPPYTFGPDPVPRDPSGSYGKVRRSRKRR